MLRPSVSSNTRVQYVSCPTCVPTRYSHGATLRVLSNNPAPGRVLRSHAQRPHDADASRAANASTNGVTGPLVKIPPATANQSKSGVQRVCPRPSKQDHTAPIAMVVNATSTMSARACRASHAKSGLAASISAASSASRGPNRLCVIRWRASTATTAAMSDGIRYIQIPSSSGSPRVSTAAEVHCNQ